MIHTMKEQLRLFWEQKNKQEAGAFLVRWIIDAMESDVKQLRKIASTLIEHLQGLIHYSRIKLPMAFLRALITKLRHLNATQTASGTWSTSRYAYMTSTLPGTRLSDEPVKHLH